MSLDDILRSMRWSLMKPKASLVIVNPRKAKMTPQVEEWKIFEPAAECRLNLFRKATFLDRANIYIFQGKEIHRGIILSSIPN
jgi:hypothetical protein